MPARPSQTRAAVLPSRLGSPRHRWKAASSATERERECKVGLGVSGWQAPCENNLFLAREKQKRTSLGNNELALLTSIQEREETERVGCHQGNRVGSGAGRLAKSLRATEKGFVHRGCRKGGSPAGQGQGAGRRRIL